MTVKEAAFQLGRSTDTIYNFLRSGKLIGIQQGGKWCTVEIDPLSVEKMKAQTYEIAIKKVAK